MKFLQQLKPWRWVGLMVVSLTLGACASSVPLDEGIPAQARSDAATGSVAVQGQGAAAVASVQSQGVQSKNSAPVEQTLNRVGRIIYFELDSYSVAAGYANQIQTVARALLESPSSRLVLEGHTDERGGSEYNLALGQRRADAVVQQLRLMGVPDSQLESVSFGKERPAQQGSSEAAWAKNRRVEMR